MQALWQLELPARQGPGRSTGWGRSASAESQRAWQGRGGRAGQRAGVEPGPQGTSVLDGAPQHSPLTPSALHPLEVCATLVLKGEPCRKTVW